MQALKYEDFEEIKSNAPSRKESAASAVPFTEVTVSESDKRYCPVPAAHACVLKTHYSRLSVTSNVTSASIDNNETASPQSTEFSEKQLAVEEVSWSIRVQSFY